MNANADLPLQGVRILVAEDDAILAVNLGIIFQRAGAEIFGPALTLPHTLALAQAAPINAAVLDITLRDEDVFPAAHVLKGRGIGIVFYTGYAAVGQLRREWPQSQVLAKPAPERLLVEAVLQALVSGANAAAAS